MDSRIPNVCHFTYFRGPKNWRWRDIHSLALWTAKHVAKFEKLIVFYDVSGEGEAWSLAQSIPGVEWRPTTFQQTVNGNSVRDQRWIHDVHRLRTLCDNGGWYADLDFIFLKAFEPLRDNEAVLGIQCKQKSKLNNAIIGALPNNPFIKAFIDKYKEWTPSVEKKIWTYANTIPWELSRTIPITIMSRNTFYPVAWSNKTFWTGDLKLPGDSYAVHLWETLHPDLTVADLMKTDAKAAIIASGFPQ